MTYHKNVSFTSLRENKGGWVGAKNPPNLEVTVYILCMRVRSAVGKLKKKKIRDQVMDLQYMDAVSLFNFYLD